MDKRKMEMARKQALEAGVIDAISKINVLDKDDVVNLLGRYKVTREKAEEFFEEQLKVAQDVFAGEDTAIVEHIQGSIAQKLYGILGLL